jgi:ribosomal protein S18 acetylase RimI-like enzyme
MLRPARAGEAGALRALVERAYGPYVPLIGRRPAPMDDDYAARIAAGQATVLDRNGALLGLLVMVTEPDHLCLDNIAVDPGAHHQGTGRFLMQHVFAEARRCGLPEVRLVTNEKMARNIGIYTRLGFEEYARQEMDGFRRVLMRKRLD